MVKYFKFPTKNIWIYLMSHNYYYNIVVFILMLIYFASLFYWNNIIIYSVRTSYDSYVYMNNKIQYCNFYKFEGQVETQQENKIKLWSDLGPIIRVIFNLQYFSSFCQNLIQYVNTCTFHYKYISIYIYNIYYTKDILGIV